MPRNVTGVDLGLRTAKFLRGHVKGNTFVVTDFDVQRVASKEIVDGWNGLAVAFKPTDARVGLTGRDVNVRYVRVPRVPDWQLRNLMRFEVEEIGDQSGSGVASDFNLLPPLPEIEGEDVAVLAMAREGLLEAHVEGLEKAGGRVDAFSPNAIALFNAFSRYGVVQDETVLLANVGYDNLDVVIVRGPDLIFARNLSGGSRLFEDAIAQRLGCSQAAAVELKESVATLDPQARFASPDAERASRAMAGAAGQFLSLLQSAVLFSKNQVKISGLKLDRVLLCGGGAALQGLPKYLANGLSVPVELFDPFRVVELGGLAPDKRALLEDHKLEAVVALGLATMASDKDAYSIEILPKALAKRREFLGGTIWLVAAGVLAAGYLGFSAWRTKSELDTATARARTLDSQYKKANATHRKTEELVAENQKLSAQVDELAALKGSGEQMARALELFAADIPEGFWITQFSTDYRADPELRVQRGAERPILTAVGRAREGQIELAQLYEKFITSVRGKLPAQAAMSQKLAPNGSKFTLDLTFFAAAEAPPANAEAAGDTTRGGGAR